MNQFMYFSKKVDIILCLLIFIVYINYVQELFKYHIAVLTIDRGRHHNNPIKYNALNSSYNIVFFEISRGTVQNGRIAKHFI